MAILDEDVSVMTQAGLTVMQAKIYLALLKLNTAPVKKIAKESNIDRSNCYRTILLLQDLGLVSVFIARPNLYRATPIKAGVNFLIAQQDKKFEATRKATAKLVHRFSNQQINKTSTQHSFIIIPKKTTFITKVIENINNSQKSIKCISSLERFSQALYYSFESHKAALNRGVVEQTIIEKPANRKIISQSLQNLMDHSNFEIRYLNKRPEALGACIDHMHVGILVEPKNNIRASDMLSSTHPSLIAIFSGYFKNLWMSATELKT